MGCAMLAGFLMPAEYSVIDKEATIAIIGAYAVPVHGS